jgi:hypothetical protein
MLLLTWGAHCIYIVHAPTGCRSKVRSYCMSCAGLQVTGGNISFIQARTASWSVWREETARLVQTMLLLLLACARAKRNSVEQRLPMILQQTVHQLTNSQGTIQRRAAVIHILFFRFQNHAEMHMHTRLFLRRSCPQWQPELTGITGLGNVAHNAP